MNKTELCQAVAEKAGLDAKKADAAVKAFMEVVTEELAAGGTVQLLGFGTFKTVHKDARMVRVPTDGSTKEAPPADVPQFKAGGKLKERVNWRNLPQEG